MLAPALLLLLLSVVPAAGQVPPTGSAGVAPASGWSCPTPHPIKGNFTTYSGEPCIYHVPGGAFYGKTKPERCYSCEADARRDGCRRSKR